MKTCLCDWQHQTSAKNKQILHTYAIYCELKAVKKEKNCDFFAKNIDRGY